MIINKFIFTLKPSRVPGEMMEAFVISILNIKFRNDFLPKGLEEELVHLTLNVCISCVSFLTGKI